MRIFRKSYFGISIFALCALDLTAQVSAPTISAPEMPSISSPTLGGGFYNPRSSESMFYQGKKSQNATSSSEAKNLSEKTENSASATAQLSQSLFNLTANDIQTFGTSDILSSLLGSNATSQLNALNENILGDSSNQTNKLLQQVLSEIENLKNQTQKQNAEQNSNQKVQESKSTEKVSASQSSVRTHSSHLIRFTVNGYDILKTCRSVYISDVQSDGTFLVTGDREYSSDGKNRTETFHLLFQANANSSSLQHYNAAAAVSQDSENPYSFMYQLSKRNDLNALRTGNLVSMRTNDPAWKLELLIDLGTSAK